jgi:hypothetical protein
VAVVPGDELGGGPAPRQLLAGDAKRLVGLGAGGVDDGAVVAHQLVVRHVAADGHVAEQTAAAPERLAVEGLVEPLDLLVVGRNTRAEQPPRGGQALEQVDLDVTARPEQPVGGEGAGGAGSHDRHPVGGAGHQAAVRSAVDASAKNSAFRSSA